MGTHYCITHNFSNNQYYLDHHITMAQTFLPSTTILGTSQFQVTNNHYQSNSNISKATYHQARSPVGDTHKVQQQDSMITVICISISLLQHTTGQFK